MMAASARKLEPRLLTLHEAADYCGLTPRAFRRYIRLPPVKLGPNDLWEREALDRYIDGLTGRNGAGIDWHEAVERF